MKPIVADANLVGRCGLYCGACGAYINERCSGCGATPKFRGCPVRKCCIEHNYATCAECTEYPNPRDCKKFHNWISKLIGLILNSDRAACVVQIREKGLDGHAQLMAANKTQTIPRRKK
jgi:hypothetical protein